MNLGIFAKTFTRPTLEGVLDAVRQNGLENVQFNLVCAGLPTLPKQVSRTEVERIRTAFQERGLTMAAISGTFNMIHPDHGQRESGLRRLAVLAEAAPELGTHVITLCTGSRDPENMWKAHPQNQSREAWDDLLRSMERALTCAERHRVILGVEPEVGNVIDSAVKARALLDHFHSTQLKIVIDPANLFHTGELPRMHEIIDEAFDLLGADLVLAHAKDLSGDGDAGHEAAGTGVLDYDHYIDHLQRAAFAGALILHGLSETQVPGCISFLKEKIARLPFVPLPG